MSGHFQVIYSPAAKDDLRGIYAYIAFELKARQTASNQVNRIRKEIRALDTISFGGLGTVAFNGDA